MASQSLPEARWTKGPWTLPSRESVRFEKEIVLIEPGVAIDYDDVNHDEAYANATLITAAPDLFEALDALLYETEGTASYCEICHMDAPKTVTGELTGPVPHTDDCPIPKARAALAKARGESNG